MSGEDQKNQEGLFLIAIADVNPYPATPAMRKSGAWTGPITVANQVRMRNSMLQSQYLHDEQVLRVDTTVATA